MRINELAATSIAPPWRSGRYYFCPNTTSVATSSGQGVGSLRAVPFFVPNPVTLSKIGAEVTSAGDAGSKYRLGIYADDGNGRPGRLIVDAGQINGDSETVQELTISVQIGPGWYWAAGVIQAVVTTQPTMRVSQNASFAVLLGSDSIPAANRTYSGFLRTGITGALDTLFSADGISVTVPRIFVKVA